MLGPTPNIPWFASPVILRIECYISQMALLNISQPAFFGALSILSGSGRSLIRATTS